MRRRFGSCVLSVIFLVVGLIPSLTHPSPAYAQTFAPPLPMAEDPLGQQPEQQLPEITIDVDVRDGHLTGRVVDIWGPGRIPLVMRSYTNAQPSDPGPYVNLPPLPPNSGPFRWQFNDILNIVGAEALEPDGNRSSFRYSHDRWSGDNLHLWQVYVKDVAAYATMELHYNCPPKEPIDRGSATAGLSPLAPAGLRISSNIQSVPSNCTWDGWHTIYLAKGRVRKFSSQLIAEERDANGNIATFVHTSFLDGVGIYLLRVTDPVGRSTNYSYERAYEVCVQKGGMENIGECVATKWAYRLRSVTDPYNRTSTYTYDANTLKVLSVTNAAGHITRHTYTPSGLLATITNPRGFTTTFDWTTGPDGTPRIAKVTAVDGIATNYAYTHASTAPYRVIKTVATNALGYATTHDISNGDVVKVTNPLGQAAQYAYDSRHNVTQVSDPLGRVTTFAFNAHNKVTQVVQASGTLNLTTALAWNTTENPPNDNLASVTNPRGIRTDYTYDSKHNLASVRRAVGTPDESLTEYTYHPWGGVATVRDPLQKTTSFAYTARRQLQTVTPPLPAGATTYGYDAVDDHVSMTNGNGRIWTTAYNLSRLVISVKDPLNNVVSHEYDANGNRTRSLDAKIQATAFEYDNRDRLIKITDARNGITQYEYDAVSNLMRIINARTHATSFEYDNANRLQLVRDALLQATTYTYDQAGNRLSMRDRKGATHTYTYDQVNRLTRVTAGGLTVSYVYDANGNRTSMTDGSGPTTFAYDKLDRLIQTTTPDTRSVSYLFDKNGNRTRLTYPDGSTTLNYLYDNANRLTQISTGTLAWTLSYDPAGNRTALIQPNGTRTDYAYLNNNWLQSITHKRPDSAIFQSFTYNYDANGNRVSQADGTGTTTFTYDALNRLTAAAYPGTYGSWSWAYDSVGNRTSQTAPSGTTPYSYDANNRLTTAGAVNYSYDANGNLISTTAGQSFSWDVFNRLTGASGSGGSVSYTYNGDGLKLRRTGPDGATVYYYDGIRPIWETDGAGALKAQLDRDIFGNLIGRREVNGNRRYFAHDGLGGLTGVTDEGGTHVASLFYDAMGNIRATGGTWTTGNYRFTGAELDPATGLYHMGARFYDPGVGRWLSEDLIQWNFNPSSLNLYAYVLNNPVNLVDLTGLAACELECLNTLRTEAALVTLSLPEEMRVAAYIGYREAARIAGHGDALDGLRALADEVNSAKQASTRPTRISETRNGIVSKDLIKAIYAFAASQFALNVIVEWSVIIARAQTGNWQGFFQESANNPFAGRFTAALVLAMFLDARYHQGEVWRDFIHRLTGRW